MDIQHKTLTVNGVDYVQKGSELAPVIGEKRIIVADRGWVFVGDCEDHEDGTVTINNARNIRRWGTSRGLGELANGPLPETKHDAYGVVRCTPIIQIGVTNGW